MLFPRCCEVGSVQRLHIISTVVRSGLPTCGLPRCREVGSIQQVIYYSHGREVGFTDKWFATMLCSRVYPTVYDGYMVRFMMSIWYGI